MKRLAHNLNTTALPVGDLHLYHRNPRRGSIPAIAESLERLGQYRPIVVNQGTHTGRPLEVLAGNHTVLAARHLGWDTIQAVTVDVDEDHATRIVIADNRTSDLAGYDDDLLAAILQGLPDLEGTGFSDADLEQLLADAVADDTHAPIHGDPDDAPALPEQAATVTEPGQVWELGPHRLLCGDATDLAAVEALMGGERADCMWTDPPYGVDYVGGSHQKTHAERRAAGGMSIRNDGAADLPRLLAGAFKTAGSVLKPGAPIYLAHPQGPLAQEFVTAFQDAGWLLRQNLVWVKDSMVLSRSDYHYQHEPLIYGFTPGGEGRLGRGGERWYGDNAQVSVFEVPRPKRSDLHPTMKPVDLIVAMLRNSCPRGGTVFDPFGGSGSTLIAAHTLGQVARLVELDSRYADVICRRWQEATGVLPKRAGVEHDFASG